MYGEWIDLVMTDQAKIQVWVFCTPHASDREKRDRAWRSVQRIMDSENLRPVAREVQHGE